MKRIIILFFLGTFLINAQESPMANKKNEFRVDVLSAIAYGKTSFSYERFLKKDFSIGVNVNFSNNSKIEDEFNDGFRNNLPKYEINPYLRYALSKSKSRYYFAEIFASANGGDFKEIIRTNDGTSNGYYIIEKSKYTDIGLGGSLGYKMYIKQAWAIEFLVGFGKNLTNTAKSPDVISRVGINLGYRF